MLGLIFGHTVFAITTVLVAFFMAGLALGAAVLGRLVDLIRVGPCWCTACAGRWNWPVRRHRPRPPRFRSIRLSLCLYPARLALRSPPWSVAQFVLTFLIVVVPTALMGGTLPVIGKFLVKRVETAGRKVADLYALQHARRGVGRRSGRLRTPAGDRCQANDRPRGGRQPRGRDLGPDGGLAGREDGRRGYDTLAGLVSCLVPRERGAILSGALVGLAGIGLSGAASRAYEITWMRALGLVIGSSIYAFSAMLTTFLVGLALGSFLFARIWGNRTVGAGLFGWLEIGVGFAALLLIPALERMPDLVLTIMRRLSPSARTALLTQFSLSFLAMIVPYDAPRGCTSSPARSSLRRGGSRASAATSNGVYSA